MTYSKSFPRVLKGSTYPVWEEITLTAIQEKEVEELARKELLILMNQCLDDAKKILISKGLNNEDNVVNLAVSLFEKQSSHVVYYKDQKCKDIFNQTFPNTS